MSVSAGFDEFQQYSDILSFSPLAVERFSENLMKEQTRGQDIPGIIVSPTQHNNNKRKRYSHENAPEVKRQARVRPLDLGTTQVEPQMSSSALTPYCSSSLSLTPPLTPHMAVQSYFPPQGYGLNSQTQLQNQASYFQYDFTRVSPGYQQESGPPSGRVFPKFVYDEPQVQQQPLVQPQARGRPQSVSAALSFLYEKSLASVRRWRENGLTVQLFYCAVCQLPVDCEERVRSHIETAHVHQGVQGAGQQGHHCKGCGKEMGSQQAVDRHQEECGLYRPYRCEFCGKTFIISARLKHHRVTCQAAPAPAAQQCKVCCKKFSRRDQYLLHLPVHAFYLWSVRW